MTIQNHPSAIPATEFSFTSTDGLRVACFRWDSLAPLRGVIQIAHRMGEHIGNYLETIEFLAQNGFTVYGSDHRGHGRTAAANASFGDFGEGGLDPLVEDTVTLSRIAKGENPNVPFLLLGLRGLFLRAAHTGPQPRDRCADPLGFMERNER